MHFVMGTGTRFYSSPSPLKFKDYYAEFFSRAWESQSSLHGELGPHLDELKHSSSS